jgi:hypothetical protein
MAEACAPQAEQEQIEHEVWCTRRHVAWLTAQWLSAEAEDLQRYARHLCAAAARLRAREFRTLSH